MTPSAHKKLRLVLIDDHALFLQGLASLLGREEDLVVAGCFAAPSEALPLLESCAPDVILLDYNLGSERALEFVRTVRGFGTTARFLIVTAGLDPAEAVQLVEAGAAGIFHKHQPPEALVAAVRRVAAGDAYLEPQYLKPLFDRVDASRPRTPELTQREKEVIRGLLEGLLNKEIGARLGISEGAVKACLRQLFQRLGVRARSHLVRVALERYRDQL